MTNYIITVFLFLLMFSSGALGNDQCDLKPCPLVLELKEGKDEIITSGHFNLLWPANSSGSTEGGEAGESSAVKDVLLQHKQHPATHLKIATEQSFSQVSHTIKVHSTQRAVSLTGFSDGTYFARLFDQNDRPVSNSVKVMVEHHSMQRVWIIFSSGAVLFLLLIGYMVAKVFRHKEEE